MTEPEARSVPTQATVRAVVRLHVEGEGDAVVHGEDFELSTPNKPQSASAAQLDGFGQTPEERRLIGMIESVASNADQWIGNLQWPPSKKVPAPRGRVTVTFVVFDGGGEGEVFTDEFHADCSLFSPAEALVKMVAADAKDWVSSRFADRPVRAWRWPAGYTQPTRRRMIGGGYGVPSARSGGGLHWWQRFGRWQH